MTTNTPSSQEIENKLEEFHHGIDSLMLATVNGEGLPEASYAAYVEYEGCFYIFVSELASHTKSLKQSGVAGVMFMENEADVRHAFARKRLTCQCQAAAVERNEPLFETVMQQMEERFGNLIVTLRGLGDFHLVQLKPLKGNFVAGFGKTYEVDYSQGGAIKHKRPD